MVARNCDLCCSARSSCQPFSRISLIRRTFSMAIAAWSANTVASSICLAEKGSTLSRASASTPISWPSRVIGRPSIVPSRRSLRNVGLRSLRRRVGDGNRARAAHDAGDEIVPGRRGRGRGGQPVGLLRHPGTAAGHPAEGAVLEADRCRPSAPGTAGSRCRGRPAAPALGRRSSGLWPSARRRSRSGSRAIRAARRCVRVISRSRSIFDLCWAEA